jgi:hypothetical protein
LRQLALGLGLATALLGCAAFGQTPDVSGFVSGAGSATDTSATTIIAAVSNVRRIYVTAAQCGRTDAGTTAVRVTFNDDAATVMVLPNSGGGGFVPVVFPSPLTVAASSGFKFTASGSISTIYCNAQGFTGN